MTGFFEDRLKGVQHGFGMMYDGGVRYINEAFGWEEIPEASPGLIGSVVETARAAARGLFGENDGLLRFDKGYNQYPWEKESVWNVLRHVRRATSVVLNTSTTFTTKLVGILSPAAGNFCSRMLQGAFTTVLAPILGDISPHLGPSTPTVYNDGSYKAANSGDYNLPAANDSTYAKSAPPTPEAPKVEPVATSEPPKAAAEPEKKAS